MVLFLLSMLSSTVNAQTYEKLWEDVRKSESKGLPRTSLEIINQIVDKAKTEWNLPELLKAMNKRIQFTSTPLISDTDTISIGVVALENLLEQTTDEADKAVIHSLLAMTYSEFAYDNEYLIRRNVIVGDSLETNYLKWTPARYMSLVLDNCRASLVNPKALMDASVRSFTPFAVLGTTSEYYHHDLYHLLCTNAIKSLKRMEWCGQDSLIDTNVEGIYQQMFTLYDHPKYQEGMILARLDYINQMPSKDRWINDQDEARRSGQLPLNPYISALNYLLTTYPHCETNAETYLALARFAFNARLNDIALRLCKEGISKYGSYKRINVLRDMQETILRPYFETETSDEVYPLDSVAVKVHYYNIDGLQVKLYNDDEKCVATHKFKLKVPDSHIDMDTTLYFTAPQAGDYTLKYWAMKKGKIQKVDKNQHEEQDLNVCNIKLLLMSLPDNRFQAVVVDAKSGQPVKDASVCYSATKESGLPTLTYTTDETGKVEFSYVDKYRNLRATYQEDNNTSTMYVSKTMTNIFSTKDREQSKVQLLTDRSIYRPGQTVHVKGIAYEQKSLNAQVLSGKTYTVTLYDANDQEVGKQELTTNEFGSFATSFELPSACLNGNFRLHTAGGTTSIKVEDYKRPSFEVNFKKPDVSYKLDDIVYLSGDAMTFSGVPLRDLQVDYKVTRRYFSLWRYMPVSYGESVTATGSELINATGDFTIPVYLKPAEDHANSSLIHYYTYIVQATVTNLAGETQSATFVINAGTRSMRLNAELGERMLKSDSLQTIFTAHNLNNEPVSVQGNYMLYAMKGAETEDEAKKRKEVLTAPFTSNQPTSLAAWRNLPSGKYLIVLEAKDSEGQMVDIEKTFVLFDTADKRPPVKSDLWYYAVNTEFDAEHPASFYFGTSYKDTYVLVNVLAGGKVIESTTLQLNDNILHYQLPYKESYGNGMSLNFCFVKNFKDYQQTVTLKQRLPDTKLTMKWDVFRDKLRPGQHEEWRLTIKRPDGMPANAEMLATMYDASLDKIWPNNQALQVFYNLRVPNLNWQTLNAYTENYSWVGNEKYYKCPLLAYDHFDWSPFSYSSIDNVVVVAYGYGRNAKAALASRASGVRVNGANPPSDDELMLRGTNAPVLAEAYAEEEDSEGEALEKAPEDLRTNLAETAFFYPFLRTNEEGEVVLSFTMPQSLTSWNFRGYAHTKEMLTGMLDGTTVTAKDFMLSPYMPRFVRIGDQTTIAATIANLTDKTIAGTVSMTLFNPMNEKIVLTRKQPFSVDAKQTIGVDFSFTVPQGYELLGCRMIADGGTFSDGEQQILPVLSDKIRLTETVAMPIMGNETRTFSLDKLFNNHSSTAANRSLTVEFTGNPAWYAVQALPTLTSPIFDNAINWAAANYANGIAEWIANSQPRIAEIVRQWKDQDGTAETFISQLQKNQELKTIILNESPWVLEAQSQQEQMERISTLFDIHMMRNNTITALTRLQELQNPNGLWSWFRGMNGSSSVTLYIAILNARQAMLTGQPMDVQLLKMQKSALTYLHKEMLDYYNRLTKKQKESFVLHEQGVQYLYLSKISGSNMPSPNAKVYEFLLDHLYRRLDSSSMKTKAMAAIILEKAGAHSKAMEFIASLKEHLTSSPNQGMYFNIPQYPYSWEGSQLEAQVYAMEAFQTVAKDAETVEAMKLWLLTQKQTQAWRSTVATTDALYGLLMTGDNLLDNTGNVRITVGNKTINTNNQAAALPGLDYVKETFINKSMIDAKTATVRKTGEGPAWGAIYAQYDEAMSAVEQQGEGMSITKKLYIERYAGDQRQLFPITEGTALEVGDIVVSMLSFQLDRSMQFVQLKDQRAACFEPVESLSGYRWNNGFGYYVDIKDASTNFFFDRLSKGEYTLQYTYRVSRAGIYETGVATLQCAYAPEYSAHSASSKVAVR